MATYEGIDGTRKSSRPAKPVGPPVSDVDREWDKVLAVLKEMNMNIDLNVYKAVAGEGPTYPASIPGIFGYGRILFADIIKLGLSHSHAISKNWYYRNDVANEIDGWAEMVVENMKQAAVDTWEMLLSCAKSAVDPANAKADAREAPQSSSDIPTLTQNQLNYVTVMWYLSVFRQLSLVEWSRVVPLPSLGPRPIVLRETLRAIYEPWKIAVLQKVVEVMGSMDGSIYVKGAFITKRNRPSTTGGNYLINYPDIRVDDQKHILSFPKKEVAGSGLGIAKKLRLCVPNPTGNALPQKYFQGNPQVGNVPLPGGFPSTFSEFTSEDVFWLVVFYNESFALQCRCRSELPSEHVFEVWWHLSYMAEHGGRPPSDEAFNEFRSLLDGRKSGERNKLNVKEPVWQPLKDAALQGDFQSIRKMF